MKCGRFSHSPRIRKDFARDRITHNDRPLSTPGATTKDMKCSRHIEQSLLEKARRTFRPVRTLADYGTRSRDRSFSLCECLARNTHSSSTNNSLHSPCHVFRIWTSPSRDCSSWSITRCSLQGWYTGTPPPERSHDSPSLIKLTCRPIQSCVNTVVPNMEP